jgi:hypothetical protein
MSEQNREEDAGHGRGDYRQVVDQVGRQAGAQDIGGE